MTSRLKTFFIKHQKTLLIILAVAFYVSTALAGTSWYLNENNADANANKAKTPVAAAKSATPTTAAAKKAVKESPPKYSSGGVSTTENGDGSKTTTVSDGSADGANTSAAASAGSSSSSPSSIHYIDETGQNGGLGVQLTSYIASNLLYASEVPALYAIIVEDAGDTGWAGLYSASYTEDPSGRITSAWGYITLNTYYYKNSPYFVDYMKLVLSHEYGHHFTLYHKWLAWQSPFGERFPDSYYSVRPLTKSGTAADYSLGWGNCDAEIIAEDYSYLYSGYGVDAMAGTYGYPSAATKTWLKNEPSGSSGQSVPDTTAAPQSTPVPVPTATPAPSVTSTVTVTSAPDTQNPVVTITDPSSDPYSWSSGNLQVAATATDNVSVSKIEFYVNDQLAATQNSASINRTWMQNGTPAGAYTLKAKAYDTSGNTAETSITVNKTF